ncbi:MAG TPA: glycosyltransferase family 4 protein [Thermoplasmata archaeon]|nr:glycosyltransferase family 4 protein [Thermoplasmata archaeon]
MEVAFFTELYPPIHDGVSAITEGLARTLSRLGHTVRVYAPNPKPGASSEETRNGIAVRRLRTVPVPLYGQYRWPIWPYGLIRSIHGLKDADVLHLHTPGPLGSMAFLASRRFGRPLVGTFHTNIREMQDSVPSKFLVPTFFRVAWWYNLGTYYRCDATTAPSSAAADALMAGSRKPFHRPVEVIPNGIDVDRFRPDSRVPDWRTRCGLSSAPLVTFLGRLTVDKGVHRFLDAVEATIPKTDLVAIIGGQGPEEARVRERLTADPALAAHVRYVGPVAESEKAALLSQTDVFVLPSTSDTSSVALLEAMACGTPVVAPSSGGASEMVEEGVTGWRVPVTNPGALAAALERILDTPQDRLRMGVRATEFVRQTASLDTMARRFISLYRLVEEGRPLRDVRNPA